MNTHSTSRCRARRGERGSLLIVAMIMAAVIGISLASYLTLSRTAMNISNRAVYNNAAINLAEQGVEEAIYAINKMVANPLYDWNAAGWTISGTTATRLFSGVALSQNAVGKFRVYIYNYNGIVGAPKILSRASVSLDSRSAPIEKWLEVQLSQTSKFASGLIAKNSIVFNGNNATVDSWNSEKNPDGTARAAPVPFATGYKNDEGTVGSISVASDAVLVKNADVWGYVSTGNVDPATFVGTTGSILGEDSPTGTNVDPNRTDTNFAATFDPVTAPTETPISISNITAATELPRPSAGDPQPVTIKGETYYYYETGRINLTNEALNITGRVILNLTATGASTGSAVSIGGSTGTITIGANATLIIYTAGNIDIGGQGVSNGVDDDSPANGIQQDEMGQPKRFQIYGTKTSGTQDVAIAGTGLFSGVIYAPQGNVTLTGNGAISGSVVANNITLNGNAKFHYDESLKDMDDGNPYRVSIWKELTTAASRAAYSLELAF